MPSFRLNTKLQGGSLAPGQSHSFFSLGLGHNEVAVVTAIPSTTQPERILAVENLRVASKDADGDPTRHVLYNVKNVGTMTVPSYTVNVAIFSP